MFEINNRDDFMTKDSRARLDESPIKGLNDAGATRVAMRTGTSQTGTVYYLLGDHLGSLAITATSAGSKYAETRYYLWGTERYNNGTSQKTYRFTGQRLESTIGLYYYGARWYDPMLGRFVQADTIIPQAQEVQAWDRYAYANNNPIKYKDPSGRAACIDEDCILVENSRSTKPILRNITKIPEVVSYMYIEMKKNASSSITKVMSFGNTLRDYGPPIINGIGSAISSGLWTSQVMDARIKNHAGPLSPYIGNWDHKQKASKMNTTSFRSDIWSNIHYGYVGTAAGFTTQELTGGAGIEQIGSDIISGNTPVYTSGADNWVANWDDPSDNAAIQLGTNLWNQFGSSLSLAEFYYSILTSSGLAIKY